MGICQAPGCERETWTDPNAKARGAGSEHRFCAAHQKQMVRRGYVTELREKKTERERLMDAMDGIRDCDSEDDDAWRNAWVHFWKVVRETKCAGCEYVVKLRVR